MADEPAGRAWARAKFDWLDRVADDLAGRHLVFCVAHALLRDTDKATGITGIAQREIAEKIVAGLRSVQLAIDKLESVGFLTVIKPKGPRLGNRYRLHLPPEPSKDPTLAQPSALKSDPSLAQPSALNEASLAHPDSLFSESHCAPYPRSSPVRDHPRPGAAASPTQTTTTIGVADDGLLDRIVAAIEEVGKKLAKRKKPHNLEPIRNLIAGGISVDLVVSVIAKRAAKLTEPLGNLDAPWLLDAIREQAAVDGYSVASASASTAQPATSNSKYVRVLGELRLVADVWALLDRHAATGTWDYAYGGKPGDEDFELPPMFDWRNRPNIVFPGGYRRSRAQVEAHRDRWNSGFAWDVQAFGLPPDDPHTSVPADLRGPRLYRAKADADNVQQAQQHDSTDRHGARDVED